MRWNRPKRETEEILFSVDNRTRENNQLKYVPEERKDRNMRNKTW
jgi:hypothetical protein